VGGKKFGAARSVGLTERGSDAFVVFAAGWVGFDYSIQSASLSTAS
jgi:hypothetical protein